MSRSSISLLLLPLLACACQNQGNKTSATGAPAAVSTDLPATTPVAKVGKDTITAGELDASLKGKLDKLRTDYVQQVYDTRRQALDQMIFKKVLGEKAKAAGLEPEQYFGQEVEKRAPRASDADIKKFYDENKDKMGGQPIDAMKDRINQYLSREKQGEAARTYFEEIKKEAKVEVLLPEPQAPRVTVAATGPAKGPENAPVTIVTFSDFQCPYCSRALESVDKVMKEYDGKVRLVFRDFPLSFHPNAQKASEAGQCANAQGKFWQMHDYMFAHQNELAVDALKKAAKEIGLDTAKFDACLDSGQFAQLVQENQKAGQEVGVEGTPAFFINGRQISGAQPFERFKSIIDDELAKKK